MKKEVIDHLGRTVKYEFPPKRIISLCPGMTETLYTLNLENEIVGRTRYCIYPSDKVEGATIVGGIKEIDPETIGKLNPDLIIVEKEENTPEIVAALEKRYPVYSAEVQSVQDAYRMIEDIAALTDRELQGQQLVGDIKKEFAAFSGMKGKRAAYIIWRNPYMAVGNTTYINSLLEEIGFINPFAELDGRYPSVGEEEFQRANLDYIFLASEPFPFKEKHKAEFLKMAPNAEIHILDGEMFWYGAKMKKAAKYLNEVMSTL